MTTPRQQLADELLRRFAAALRLGSCIRGPIRSSGATSTCSPPPFSSCTNRPRPSSSASSATEIVVDDVPVTKADTLGGLTRRLLKQIAIERITIDRGVTREEIGTLVDAVTTLEVKADQTPPPFPTLKHIRVGPGHRRGAGRGPMPPT